MDTLLTYNDKTYCQDSIFQLDEITNYHGHCSFNLILMVNNSLYEVTILISSWSETWWQMAVTHRPHLNKQWNHILGLSLTSGIQLIQVAQLSQRPRCRVDQLWPKMEDWNWEIMFTDTIFNHCDIIGPQSYQILWKMLNKGYYAVQGHSRSSKSVSVKSAYATFY